MSSIVAASSPTPAEKQGIAVAILGSDGGERAKASLRRTLSADMSSKKWLAQNGFCLSPPPMKKTASSKELFLNPIADSDDEDEEVKVDRNRRGEFDIWSSIVSQGKPGGGEPRPPPYVHPMVKRAASSLSEKSLQICTESLGSETGSDGFSSSRSDADSDHSDSDGDYFSVAAELRTVRKPAAAAPAPARSFPPPLPSLASRGGGDGAPALRMRSRRDNGRLVVEAVAVPASPPPNFSAQRRDGRLVLKLARTDRDGNEFVVPNTPEELEDLEEQFDGESEAETEEEEDDEEEEKNKKVEHIAESRLINFHRLALMANKPIGLPNRNIKEEEDLGDRKAAVVAQSLPPMPRLPAGRLIPPPAAAKVSTTAAASFNHYDYFWRAKIGASNDGFKKQTTSPNDKRESVVSRGDGNGNGYYLVPLLKGCCKEPRRTLVWQTRCIATS